MKLCSGLINHGPISTKDPKYLTSYCNEDILVIIFQHSLLQNQKHPDLPKKPLSSYMLFFMDCKDEIAKKNPDLAMVK